jgi:transcriptional regulator with XRE-family HTH domain
VARLRLIRQQLGLSQTEWASRSGVGLTTVSNLLSGADQHTGKPSRGSLSTIMRLCRAVDFPIWVLMHPSPALFTHFLSRVDRASSDVSAEDAMAIALAIVREGSQAGVGPDAEWQRELAEFLDDGRSRRPAARQAKATA